MKGAPLVLGLGRVARGCPRHWRRQSGISLAAQGQTLTEKCVDIAECPWGAKSPWMENPGDHGTAGTCSAGDTRTGPHRDCRAATRPRVLREGPLPQPDHPGRFVTSTQGAWKMDLEGLTEEDAPAET